MRIAILTDKDEVFVEFPEPVFRELLRTYLTREKNVDKALDAIILDLKKQTVYK